MAHVGHNRGICSMPIICLAVIRTSEILVPPHCRIYPACGVLLPWIFGGGRFLHGKAYGLASCRSFFRPSRRFGLFCRTRLLLRRHAAVRRWRMGVLVDLQTSLKQVDCHVFYAPDCSSFSSVCASYSITKSFFLISAITLANSSRNILISGFGNCMT